MRMLFAALGLAAIVVQAAVAAPRPETFYISRGPIEAFTQDGTLLAWFANGGKKCNKVRVFDLAYDTKVTLPQQGGKSFNVTCNWDVVPPVRLALDSRSVTALWTLREAAPLRFDYLLGASRDDRLERRFQEVAHTSRGAGLWLGGIAGGDGTLVYSVTSVDFVDEVACLSDPKAPQACAMRVGRGGGVYRIVGRKPVLIPGTEPGAMELAVAHDTVAYVPSAAVGAGGGPRSGSTRAIAVRVASNGRLVARVHPRGTPEAIALSAHTLATLERTSGGLRIAWYASRTGRLRGSVPVPKATSPELSVSNMLIVFRVGRTIHTIDVATRKVRTVARAAAPPIGLSLVGSRLAWAENVRGKGRVRILRVG
jgi:hypothetical protein